VRLIALVIVLIIRAIPGWLESLVYKIWGDDEKAMKKMPRKREEGDL